METPLNLINEKETRALAFVVFIGCIVFLITNFIYIYWFLLMEFLLRVFTNIAFTPVKLLNNWILRTLKITPNLIPLAPKKLAAFLGMLFCICILITYYYDFLFIEKILVGLMTLFSFLEFSISLCVATVIYYKVVKK